MRANIFFASATISSALSFIEGLIPIFQIILLSLSLILTISGLFNTLVDKIKKNENIGEVLDKGITEVKDLTNQLSEKINNIERGDNDGNRTDKN